MTLLNGLTYSLTRHRYNQLSAQVVTKAYKLNEIMKRFLFGLLAVALSTGAYAQSNQSPTMQQSTSTTDTRQANPAQPKVKMNRQQRAKMAAGMDSTLPKNRKQRRLPPDSLRRGGATKVDSVRR